MAVGVTSILNTFKDNGVKDIGHYQYLKNSANHGDHFIGDVVGLSIDKTCAIQMAQVEARL